MTLIFTLIAIAMFASMALIAAFPLTRSPLWDAAFTYFLYGLGTIVVILGVVGFIGSVSGLL
jgi:hypothetical protein